MAAIFTERKFFLKIGRSIFFGYPLGQKFRQNCFIYVAITRDVKAISNNNNTKQAIDPINLHTKFYKDELNMFPLKE